jgi:hypothetical protein
MRKEVRYHRKHLYYAGIFVYQTLLNHGMCSIIRLPSKIICEKNQDSSFAKYQLKNQLSGGGGQGTSRYSQGQHDPAIVTVLPNASHL